MQKLPLRLLTALAVLSLLACETPYRPRGPSGGYTDFEAQPGVHYVAFEATPGTGYPKVRQYWHRRAAEVCGGPDSYMRLWTFDRDDALPAETEDQIRRAGREESAMAAAELSAGRHRAGLDEPRGRMEPDAISGRLLVEGYIVCTAGKEIPDVSQPGDLAPMCSSWEPTAEHCRSWTENAPQTEKTAPE